MATFSLRTRKVAHDPTFAVTAHSATPCDDGLSHFALRSRKVALKCTVSDCATGKSSSSPPITPTRCGKGTPCPSGFSCDSDTDGSCRKCRNRGETCDTLRNKCCEGLKCNYDSGILRDGELFGTCEAEYGADDYFYK